MGKTELAENVFKITEGSLMYMIKQNRQLLEELAKTGYKDTNKRFTPKQIKLIMYYLVE